MYPQKRRSAYRQQFKKFVISCEGSVTECEYFRLLKSYCWEGVTLDILTSRNKSSPIHVLQRVKNYRKSLSVNDEVWCVIDKDQWTSEQLNELDAWQHESSSIFCGVALSNPKFELWLLAHFQKLPTICDSSKCDKLLEKYYPQYKKHIDPKMFTLEAIHTAIGYALVTCPTGDIPLETTGTNVGKLVKRILDSSVN